MKKTSYLKELSIKVTQKRDGDNNNKKDVRKIQSWLSLYSIQHPTSGTATEIDGDFGPATERAVRNYQQHSDSPLSGMVTQEMFKLMCSNMKDAFERPLESTGLREMVVEAAHNHLENYPYELLIQGASNSGPWVRAYMDGNDGSPWFWCMGFVQAIIDQAASAQGKSFKTLFPLTYSCDVVGKTGVDQGLLTRYRKVRQDPSVIQPGDIFLIQKSTMDWVHTGVITSIRNDVIETIEGNTNQAGSRNGIAVMKRTRNFMTSKLDIFSIQPLV